jgi:uncharacterized protein YbjQ (UPF0145 family)
VNDLTFIISLIAIGYIFGTLAEKRHYRSIEQREEALLHLPAITAKNVGVDDNKVKKAEMVCGSAVISVDYFKRILAGLRNIFGGKVTSYESLIDRARREALLRMKAKAPGAAMIINVRIETSTIGRSAHKKSVACLEGVAYGTALFLED